MPLFVFPEGGRTSTGEMQPFLAGAAYLAIRAQVPLVPIALNGVYDLLPIHTRHFFPGTLTLTVGEPISTAGLTPRHTDELTARLRGAIEAMLGASQDCPTQVKKPFKASRGDLNRAWSADGRKLGPDGNHRSGLNGVCTDSLTSHPNDMRRTVLSTLALVAFAGCSTPEKRSPDAIRENTAKATAAATRDVKAVAKGVVEGLREKGPDQYQPRISGRSGNVCRGLMKRPPTRSLLRVRIRIPTNW